jgi:hypothetical protein
MPPPYSGHCQCGELRYQIRGEPVTLYVCHCTNCQKQSSSAFGMSLRIKRDDFHLLAGTLKSFTEVADSGGEKNCAFCPDCGTRIYHAPAHGRAGGTINVKPGTLDDTSWLHPIGQMWTKSAQSWVHIPNGLLNYPENPERQDELLEAWSKWQADN